MVITRLRFDLREALLAVLFASVSTVSAQTAKEINITDSRPLVGALDALEIAIGASINYEDPAYQNIADLQDLSTAQQ